MTQRRLEALERQLGCGDTQPFVFTLAVAPAGLSPAEEDRWREQHHQDCERRGVRCFTLNLGAANVQGRSNEL
jgi:hypothetical protein